MSLKVSLSQAVELSSDLSKLCDFSSLCVTFRSKSYFGKLANHVTPSIDNRVYKACLLPIFEVIVAETAAKGSHYRTKLTHIVFFTVFFEEGLG